ncbi:hypothetical protein LOAG_02410 [Loa loa]|uniref:Uncharacterized protein n=2 Tax=Loa loa TaxID=7209 RepID=A0A1S0U702_LOALO|nr:hypothetical protein LOAG_02410 [Loa loa]EFO26080.2 hypothetical protein LOAG_02410 [Loa loa]
MAIIILPLYIYCIIRRFYIQTKAAINIKYTLLDFEKLQPGTQLKGWQEISHAAKSYVSMKDEEIEGKHIAKVYRPSNSQCDTSSKTASAGSSQTTKSSRSSKPIKSMPTDLLISDSEIDDDDDKPTTSSITGNESTKVPRNIPILIQPDK